MLEACIEFAQRLIRVPSLPGAEAEIAALVLRELESLGFDRVWRDEAGNVLACIEGGGSAPPIMFNAHLDHVDPGDPAVWPSPPYAGELREGHVIGRGAVDIKGPLAAQVHALGGISRSGARPPGDVYFTAVVQEEVGGVGAVHLAKQHRFDYVVVGEPSGNQLRRGHRGRVELVLHVRGRSCHASVPSQGVNALEIAARFIAALDGGTVHRRHEELGPSTVAPTRIRTDQESANVIPGEAWVTCDWRMVPGETPSGIRDDLQALAERCRREGRGEVEVSIDEQERVSYTGYRCRMMTAHPAYLLSSDHPAVSAAFRILRESIGQKGPPGVWRFATDGGHFAEAGMTVLGFGPGDDQEAHTVGESIEIAQLEGALVGNRELAFRLPLEAGKGVSTPGSF